MSELYQMTHTHPDIRHAVRMRAIAAVRDGAK